MAYAGDSGNRHQLATALRGFGIQIDGQVLGEQAALSFDTEFGTLDILRGVPGVKDYEQLRRDSSRELIAGVRVRVASLNHLIAMKRAMGQRKDQLMVMEYVELADEIRKREADDEAV